MTAMEKHTVVYSDKQIEFELERKNVKNINLNVKPDMSIVVTANDDVPVEFIQDFVKRKAPWILKNKGYFKNTQPEQITKKEYVSGESFKYLGKQYRLKVEETDKDESVKHYQGFIYLFVKDKKDLNKKKKLLNEWFEKKAAIAFKESLDRIYPIVEKYGMAKPAIQIKLMKARWGSCNRNKKIISLNSELIKAPKYCIDYVVLHELIHFMQKNHNKEFYNFMTSLMPDWRQRKEILDGEVVRVL